MNVGKTGVGLKVKKVKNIISVHDRTLNNETY
jgi:hypothetical protein